MAYIVASQGCCHKRCWNIADVPHGTLGTIFTVRELSDDGVFELHVIQAGFATKAAAEAALKARNVPVSVNTSEKEVY